MTINFNEVIDRRGTHSLKWDGMEENYGVSPKDGIAMWVADTDFRPPEAVNQVLHQMADQGVHGYYTDDTAFKNSITSWMSRHHNWDVDPDWIYTVHGLGAAISLCMRAFSNPGDGIILFTPVYHAFAHHVNANNRVVVESPLSLIDGRYEMDLAALESNLTGSEKIVIWCSPHNPGGRVWSVEELQEIAAFCKKNDLILISDEVHHDLVFDGYNHVVMPNACPEIWDRLIMLTAPSKTFNIPGGMCGTAIIKDEKLREKFGAVFYATAASPNRFGKAMTEAAYNTGDEWLEKLRAYLTENRRIFDEGVNAIPGVKSMELQSTFLAWVDFSGTGMAQEEVIQRIEKSAKIAANYGTPFGTGGESFIRFNLGCPKSVILDAVARLQEAFKDLQ